MVELWSRSVETRKALGVVDFTMETSVNSSYKFFSRYPSLLKKLLICLYSSSRYILSDSFYVWRKAENIVDFFFVRVTIYGGFSRSAWVYDKY